MLIGTALAVPRVAREQRDPTRRIDSVRYRKPDRP
jgi:hypothetical protein